jgi:hypothetical protein
VAQYLRQELHGLFESVDKSIIPELFTWMKEIGGYFKRFKGGALSPWITGKNTTALSLEARATLAFFEVSVSTSLSLLASFIVRWIETYQQMIQLNHAAQQHQSLYSTPLILQQRHFSLRKN